MSRSKEVELMKEVRQSVGELVTSIFDAIDKEIKDNTYREGTKTLVRAAKVRFAIKHLRQETLHNIANMGKEYEGDQ